ncbi:galactokinase (plasmid) [Fulvitalea axinellae]|uniref:Galactokinase n=1 Tax=Fulvitalea axinellae TaxID=1182444 RepID=A0AAU9DLZ7_9BACT|nr:galactokinase [Fulvitalea axinellae]
MIDTKVLGDKFQQLYGSTPIIARSAGRVNLIGEHTDYNDGFVLPAAIDKEIVFALAKNNSDTCRLYSVDLDDSAEFSISAPAKTDKAWANYVVGVAAEMMAIGAEIGGFDCVFGGDVPLGAGLSSSAALECALANGLNELFGCGFDKLTLVKSAQKAEHNYAGVKCGIMDQFASVFGTAGHCVRLDCRTLEYSYFPLNIDGYKLVLCDTNVKHSLASSEYNTRREQCESGVEILKKYQPEIANLRDVSLELLQAHKDEMDPVIYKRCEYVVKENARVVKACEHLDAGNLEAFGEQMYLSHEGLSNDYEVSCPELDFLVEQTRNNANVLGSRMMGGGFGGCTINLVKEEAIESFVAETAEAYQKAMGKEMKSYTVVIGDGARVEQAPVC